jgi:hypothetical protein
VSEASAGLKNIEFKNSCNLLYPSTCGGGVGIKQIARNTIKFQKI